MHFRVGQEVTLIEDGPWLLRDGSPMPGGPHPVFGRIYTIAWLYQNGDTYLQFNGFSPDYAYNAQHFRPVVKRKTSIEIFHRIRLGVDSSEVLDDLARRAMEDA